MKRWFKLLGVELRKIHGRKISYILALFLIVIAVATVGIKQYVQTFLETQAQEYQESADGFGLRIDVEEIFSEPELTLPQLESRLVQQNREIELARSIPGYDEHASRYRGQLEQKIVMEGWLERGEAPHSQENNLFAELAGNTPYNNLLIILTVVLALSIAGEYASGTMKQMFIRPYSRTQILTAKYAAALIYGLALIILNYLVYFLVHGLVFGFQTANYPIMIAFNGAALTLPVALHSVLMHLLTWLSIAMVLALVTLIAVLTRSQGATIGLTLAAGVIAPGIMVTFSEFVNWFSFLPVAFMDLRPGLTAGLNSLSSDMGFSGSSFSGLSYGLNATLAFAGWAVYLVLFLALSLLVFRKRDV